MDKKYLKKEMLTSGKNGAKKYQLRPLENGAKLIENIYRL